MSAEEDCPLFDKMAVGPTLDKITDDWTELDKMPEDCPALGLDIKLNESLLLEEPADVVVVLKHKKFDVKFWMFSSCNMFNYSAILGNYKGLISFKN